MRYAIIGGSNGLGFSIANKLLRNGNKVDVYDIAYPEFEHANFNYYKLDLMSDDFHHLKTNSDLYNGVIYTAGVGKLNYFDQYTNNDVDTNIRINLSSLIKVILLFANRIKSENDFYFMCISSIAGLVASPLFSIYSASKAGVCKYTEAVNTELEMGGFKNRITNIVATSFKGTSFNGGKTDLNLLEDLANELMEAMIDRETLHKVNESLIDSIIERYQTNPNKFACESYEYKINSGRFK